MNPENNSSFSDEASIEGINTKSIMNEYLEE